MDNGPQHLSVNSFSNICLTFNLWLNLKDWIKKKKTDIQTDLKKRNSFYHSISFFPSCHNNIFVAAWLLYLYCRCFFFLFGIPLTYRHIFRSIFSMWRKLQLKHTICSYAWVITIRWVLSITLNALQDYIHEKLFILFESFRRRNRFLFSILKNCIEWK